MHLKPYNEMDHHPVSERLVQILCARAQNDEPQFFRVAVAYYFSLLASMMRTQVRTFDGDEIPVNLYAINLLTSGGGKGRTTSFMEEEVLSEFQHQFTEVTFPLLAAKNLPLIAHKRAQRNGTDPDDEWATVIKEFDQQGPLVFSFDSGTTAAVKQARHKLLLANAGSMNLQIDEIGSNLTGNAEVLSTYLELYDLGRIKQKLVKNTSENTRYEHIDGRTPTNMLLYGTSSKLLNGSKTEDEFISMLDTGYARRCFFSFSQHHRPNLQVTPQQILASRSDTTKHAFIQQLASSLARLADVAHFGKVLTMSEDVTLQCIAYQLDCQKRAADLPEHESIRKAELSHRYFKALKLAGAYAFVDGAANITEDHLNYAIRMSEDSGADFEKLLTRDRPYVKLAKYIADVRRSVTQADLVEDLPFYPKTGTQQKDLMNLAIAYGYQNNIIIKKMYTDGVEFLRGETLEPTDLKSMILSYSTDWTTGYQNDTAPFDKLHTLTQLDNYHWVNHHLTDGYRSEEKVMPGFNMLVIDVDGGVKMSTAQLLLKDYKALFYTTKRHTDVANRFRIVLPMNYKLVLDAKDYKEFMNNVMESLPFPVDTQTNQRGRKWMTHKGHHVYQDGELFDVLPYIPKTSKNDIRKQVMHDQQSLDNLERWVLNNSGDGNRNNQLLRYALILVDAGFDFEGIRQKVISVNDKMPDKLEEAEIMGTIMVTVGKSLAKQ